jgi:hypothetical protein
MTKRRVPPGVPLFIAVCIGAAGYAAMIRPVQQEIQALDRHLASLRVQEAQATERLAEDARVARVPLPVGAARFDALWPEMAQRAGARGYSVDLLSFSPGTAGTATTVTITVRLKGPYLALDDTVRMVEELLPLWTWRTIQITNPEGAGVVNIVATGVLPLAGAPVRTTPPHASNRPRQEPSLPPPPPSPTGGRP